jgi:hypothetical protein
MSDIRWTKSGDWEDIVYETSGDGIAKITINRPEVRNAFRPQTIVELKRAFDDARDDADIGVVILTGAGDMAFCSGGDQRVRGTGGYVDKSGTSRLNVLDSEGQERSRCDQAGFLRHVIVGRPTNMHAPRIAAATDDSVLLLHAKKLKPYWQKRYRSSGDAISELRILDADRDSRADLAVDSASGTTWFTFEGRTVRQSAKVAWQDAPVGTRRSRPMR